ncbi:enoyl-CoA hydratase [Actinomycetospora sp. NBRC 106375]|uniref:enoyl-CoA hydratase/isomerase family protein n=1 Tax=Actinomycetospora sp. NBRC 106375 TaxID=3032207 RepID=UPI0024A26012|nr:enoyl-CoA hydratase-related protein [Actinomycetospora sp. NBRC 106375]GLZ47983.1 enoyl-CoA hydratase [Actinomycetospora sp. NBRC 106375]
MTEFVRLEVDGGVGTIRLDRPPMNAVNRQVNVELAEVAAEATSRADVRAVVVYGGEKTLAAGADVKEMAELSYAEMAERTHELSRGFGAVSEIPKPVVAAITGYALGGGFEIALSCDRRIAGDNATVGQPEILLGIIPGGGGTQRLARLVGPAKAKDIIFSGRFVKAAEALELGLVDEVVAPDEVYTRAHAWAAQFANGPTRALAAAKQAIDRGLDMDLRDGLTFESEVFAALFGTEDQTIGMRSFVENGPGKAQFLGR